MSQRHIFFPLSWLECNHTFYERKNAFYGAQTCIYGRKLAFYRRKHAFYRRKRKTEGRVLLISFFVCNFWEIAINA